MSDWQDEPCEVCGRMVMDELACPDRISNGDIMCVDCCGYLSVDSDDDDMHCPIDHHEFYYPDEWLVEIYSAYPQKQPNNESVLEHMNQNDLREHFRLQYNDDDFDIDDIPDDLIIQIYLDTKMPFWREGSMDTTRTPPDPYPIVINRRAI